MEEEGSRLVLFCSLNIVAEHMKIKINSRARSTYMYARVLFVCQTGHIHKQIYRVYVLCTCRVACFFLMMCTMLLYVFYNIYNISNEPNEMFAFI